MKSQSKSQAQSIRQKLAALSSKRGVKYANLETTFLIERLVARLTVDPKLSQHLVFKGGFVGLIVYHCPRYTIDLDALWTGNDIHTMLERVKGKTKSDLGDGVWSQFERQENILGIGDPVIPEPQEIATPLILSQLENLSWKVYSIESIVAEKLHALVSHGDQNSRSKDVYDLAVFLPKVNPIGTLDTARLEIGWPSAVASLSEKTAFKVTFNSLLVQLNQIENGWIEKS